LNAVNGPHSQVGNNACQTRVAVEKNPPQSRRPVFRNRQRQADWPETSERVGHHQSRQRFEPEAWELFSPGHRVQQ
jgi:hypothetical protein